MRKLLILILLGFIAAACNNDDDDVFAGSAGKNEFRVKSIKGSNAHWGDYTLAVTYRAEEVDSMWVYNANDTLARLSKEERAAGNGNDYASTFYHIYDYVPNISEDSIRKLQEKYGVEMAKDSIPIVNRELFTTQLVYEDERLWQQTFTCYVRYPDMSDGVQYLKKERCKYIYEYNANGLLSICRMFIDSYDTSDPDLNQDFQKRDIRKLIFAYDQGKVTNMEEYRNEDKYGSEASYVKANDWNFTYSANNLISVNDIAYQYSGNTLSVTRDNEITRYSYNSNGYLSRIDYANGEYVEIAYESGHGNFAIFSPLLEQTFGIPVVR